MRKNKWNVGIFLFNEAEVLDFAGPFEVFSVTVNKDGTQPFQVSTVSETGEPVKARNGLKVVPDYSFNDAPDLDILIVPGGWGAREIEFHNERVIEWIAEQNEKVDLMTSVCTGSFLLAKAGLLKGRAATTHWGSLERLGREFPDLTVKENVKFVDEGRILTSAGISAGINMSFHIITRILGAEVAKTTAKRMEYDIDIK
ncbi:DJ-1/PfpI family protein [Bacillus sp. H-16]|uniref:DJ-1/PfpI family protein n=1 Tax=Alteribacter salitolerans TaxID=2912333 RepID=UPI0019651C48|nr:DJ-1/PfpI family protein [Alteribacter salitolerans]MBM7096108.1 DJ-1/PfpI family protein [Alteribacter salitolerans]